MSACLRNLVRLFTRSGRPLIKAKFKDTAGRTMSVLLKPVPQCIQNSSAAFIYTSWHRQMCVLFISRSALRLHGIYS